MEKITLIVATEFTDAPGSRDRVDGPHSGEEFFDTLLRARFVKAQEEKKKLWIDLDNTWGYASSFISGAFGRLADEFGSKTTLSVLTFKSEDDPTQIEKIVTEVNKSENHG
jgi:hypothetical protein